MAEGFQRDVFGLVGMLYTQSNKGKGNLLK